MTVYMLIIQKITQRYDPEEDRIGLSAQDPEGRVVLLWLTQRLANRLVETLAGWLDENLKTVAAGHSLPSLHAWEQSAAQAEMTPGPPVNTAKAQGEALLRTVDLSRGPNAYVLTFRWGTADAARLVMHASGLRQWLGILHRLYGVAKWPMLAWPEWFSAGTRVPSAASALLH